MKRNLKGKQEVKIQPSYTFEQFAKKVEKVGDGKPIGKAMQFQKVITDQDLQEFKELLEDKGNGEAKKKMTPKISSQIKQ